MAVKTERVYSIYHMQCVPTSDRACINLLTECQTMLDFAAARDDGCDAGDNWNSCKSPASVSHHANTYTSQMPFLTPTQQHQSAEEII